MENWWCLGFVCKHVAASLREAVVNFGRDAVITKSSIRLTSGYKNGHARNFKNQSALDAACCATQAK
jgi:hypothetical protein